jgi:hypothetical protein
MISPEIINFEDFHSWLIKRHGGHALSHNNFSSSADTYCGLTHGSLPSDNTNEIMIDAMIELGLIEKCPSNYSHDTIFYKLILKSS